MGFLGGSVGTESACSEGDLGWEDSPGGGIDYPLQYSWASWVAQLVKNPPVMRETWVRSLGWEEPLEKGKATHCSILAGEFPWTEARGGLQSIEAQRVISTRKKLCNATEVF